VLELRGSHGPSKFSTCISLGRVALAIPGSTRLLSFRPLSSTSEENDPARARGARCSGCAGARAHRPGETSGGHHDLLRSKSWWRPSLQQTRILTTDLDAALLWSSSSRFEMTTRKPLVPSPHDRTKGRRRVDAFAGAQHGSKAPRLFTELNHQGGDERGMWSRHPKRMPTSWKVSRLLVERRA